MATKKKTTKPETKTTEPETDGKLTLDDVAAEVGTEDDRNVQRSDHYERSLPVDLTDDEMLARAAEWAESVDALEVVAAELAEAKAEAKEKTTKLESRIADLRRQVRTKRETRGVVCYDLTDYRRGCVETIRTDTGAVVSTRALRPDERQTSVLLRAGQADELAETYDGEPGDDNPEADATETDGGKPTPPPAPGRPDDKGADGE